MTTGILPLAELKPKMVANTAFFETSQTVYPNAYGITSGNWDDAGMSLGALQINFGAANRLSPYFQHMINNYDSFCHDLWINNGLTETDYSNWKTLMLGNDLTAKHDWADSISDPAVGKNGHPKGDLYQPYVEIFRQMGIHQGSIDKQVEISETNYMPSAFKIFNQMSCNSRLALASFYDLNINRGRCWALNLIQVDFDGIDADTTISATEKERQKIYQINYRGCFDNNNSASGEIDHWETTDGVGGYGGRRKLMADQGGSYFGTIYDPDVQFQMTQDIALEEKAIHDLRLGNIDVNKVYLGLGECSKIYYGNEIVYSQPYKTNEAPQTGFRKLKNDFTGIANGASVTMASGEKLWVDVKNWIACRTYYTIDGSTPTTASPLYTNALTFANSCTLKTLTVSVEGIAEAVKTLTVTVAVAPVTTISPSTTVQNNIPLTITLSTNEVGASIKYKIGTGTTVYTYTAPFQVNQSTAGVLGTSIKITYWSVGANATETEKTIIYDTSGAIPEKPVLTATAGNNQVVLSWGATLNTTSYTVLRDGVILTPSQYQTGTTYTDTTAVNGVQYSYVVQAANYGRVTPSDAKLVTPIAAVTGYRYIRIDGYGEFYSATGYTTTRMIEVEIFSGGTNRLGGKPSLGSQAVSVTGAAEVGSTTPTRITDAVKGIATGSYNMWWDDPTLNGNAGNAWVKYDLGASYAIDSIRYWAYPSRSARFKIWGTNNLADFGANGAHGAATLLWDMSTNNGTTIVGATAGTNNYHEKIGGF